MTATTKLRFLLLLIPLSATATTRFVNLSNPTPVAPFTDWGMAATNIQDAIDASVAGDLVLVTNGVYAFGGKVMSGDLTNRVAIDKAVTVQSVNGWMVTVIQGQKDPVSTNGPSAIRCAWLTNGAILSGFTLRYGATRSSGDQYQLRSGGGIWANSTNAVVSNCLLLENAAHFGGGGAYRGWLESCVVKGNVSQTDGGGCYSNVMNRCLALENAARFNGGGSVAGWNYNSAITANSANSGGGVYDGVVLNCTVTFNSAINTGGGIVSGASVFVTNTIVWANSAPSSANYSPVIPFRNSCSTPMPSGTANISADPMLLSDGIHIASNSPCRTVGLSIATGTDLDGQVWNIPPAMGCDEWKPEPVVTTPRFSFDSLGKARVSAMPVGQTPFTFRWMKGGGPLIDGGNLSGTGTTNLVVSPIFPADAGGYQLIVSNSFGAITSQVAQLVVRCVDVNGVSPLPPFTNWGNAASNIQDAVDASDSGDLILVTNGIYGRGGKVMSGDLTNRVALDKGVTLMSASGPTATIIQGAWDYATTNGPGAVRGVRADASKWFLKQGVQVVE